MVAHPGAAVRPDRLRPLNAPRPILVEADERGRPVRVMRRAEFGVRNRGRPSPQQGEGVRAILERWRIDDEWWRREISRMYFQVVLEGGQLLTLFHDLIEDLWYEQTTAVAVRKSAPVAVLAPDTVAGSVEIDRVGSKAGALGSRAGSA